MRIVLDKETDAGGWEISVVPTTDQDEAAGIPSTLSVGLTLLGLANNLLQQELRPLLQKSSKPASGGVIQFPSGLELPPGHGG